MKKIALLISGSIGLNLLKSFRKQGLKSDIIIVDKKSSNLYISTIKKLKVSKKIYFADKNFSKKLILYIKNNISIILSFEWPYIINNNYIKLCKFGIINTHSSYLPYERGVHSYVYSILKNHPKGITIHFMDKKVDAGKIFKQKKIKTKDFITGRELEIKLTKEKLKFYKKQFKKIYKLNFNKKKLPKVNIKFKQNFRQDLDKNTTIYLNKKYKAKNLINLILSRSGFKKGGAHFAFKGKNYELSLSVRKK